MPRVVVLRPSHNLDVGGVAVIGYRKNAEPAADISVKMDGYGPIPLGHPPLLPNPLAGENYDYAKGNFFRLC